MDENSPVEPQEQPKLLTAFLIAIDVDGRVYLERNKEAIALDIEREASMIEVRRHVSEVLMDLQAQAAAEYTLTALMAAQAPASE